MKTNEGTIDRVLRVILGIVLLVIGFGVMDGTGGVIVGLVGLIPLITGLVGFCPIYRVLGICTNARDRETVTT